MENTDKQPFRLMEWREKPALAFNTSRGYIKEGVKPKDVMSYNDFMKRMQNACEQLIKDNPQLDKDNIYVELYEGYADKDCDSEVVFTWLEPESDESYQFRCGEINRLNEIKIAAEKAELERRIKENPELVKEVLKKLDMVVVFKN